MKQNTSLVKQENPSLALIERALTDPKCDPEKLSQLLAVKKEWEADEALKLFNTALHSAQVDMPIVVRDAENTHTNSKYARLETVAKAIKHIYMNHGFSVTFSEEPCDRPDFILIIANLHHIGNHVQQYRRYAPIDDKGPKGSAVKTKLHGCQSSMSYMQRQLLCSIFGVTVADDDNDGNEPVETLREDQVNDIEKYLSELPDDKRAGVLQLAGVNAIDDIESKFYHVIVKKLKATLDAQDNAGN